MDIVTISRFDSWLADRLAHLRCGPDARAYVVGALARASLIDMGRQSIVIAFHDAKLSGDFVAFQRIGDWTLWTATFGPSEQRDLIETFGRLSYYACHRMLRGSWPLYEELADELPGIVRQARCNLLVG